MTAKDLINELKKYPPKTRVGRIGHFGEFHELTLSAVRTTYEGPDGTGKMVINIEPPDIGPEPD